MDINNITYEHCKDHIIAAVVGLIGGIILTIFSCAHIISTHILKSSLAILDYTDFGIGVGVSFVLFSGTLFLNHMKKEETVNHPYSVLSNRPSERK